MSNWCVLVPSSVYLTGKWENAGHVETTVKTGFAMVFISSDSQCWYFSNGPSSLFHHSVLVDLSVSMMMH